MTTCKLHACARCGVPHVPEELRARILSGEELDVEVVYHSSGVASNVLAHGTGALNIDVCRVPSAEPVQRAAGSPGFGAERKDGYRAGTGRDYGTAGRWPAHLTHDGSEDVEAAFAAFGTKSSHDAKGTWRKGVDGVCYSHYGATEPVSVGRGDTGTASRFFYCAKASKADRAGSKHPTVKPQRLMRWLVRLVTPPGGTVLDPFAGSGSTLTAALSEGFNAIGIEQDAEFVQDIHARLAAYESERAARAAASAEDVPPLLAAMAAE